MTIRSRDWSLSLLINIPVVEFTSALKTIIHEIFIFRYHTNTHTQNPKKQIIQFAVTAKILSQPAIQLCGICSCSIMANILSWAA
jgi:hypothetical protein